MKRESAKATAESTRLGELFDGTRAQVVELRRAYAAKDDVVRSIVQDSCATLEPSFKRLVENFRVSLNKSLSATFRVRSIGA